MLKKYVTKEVTKGNRVILEVGPDLIDDPCYYCGGESIPCSCDGDGRYHYHGRVHTPDGGLHPVCESCKNRVAIEWAKTRS